MKCAGCFKTISPRDHEDVMYALSKLPRRDFEAVEKSLSLSACHDKDMVDEVGNAVTCPVCYSKAITRVPRR